MIIYPAMDLHAGKVVRLRQGDPAQQRVFSTDPLATAQRWLDEGAKWLHLVNLDGAFDQANDNEAALPHTARLNLKVQFAGGLRSLADIQRVLELGATRVVIGTAALEQPELIQSAIDRWGAERIAVSLDSREGYIATHGWQVQSAQRAMDWAMRFTAMGLRHILFTDIQRDGGLSGVNVHATSELARSSGAHVIASGGVRGVADIQACAAVGDIAGVIIGLALYTGRITLSEALAAVRTEQPSC